MHLLSRIRRYLSRPHDFVDASLKRMTILYLAARNRFCTLSVVDARGPVVSLTTHGSRIQTVYLAIESIARGGLRPSRFILWLDDVSTCSNLPSPLRRLIRRGLEIRVCKDFGPHTKYYPYVQAQSRFVLPLVTADDDILYPYSWLMRLAQEYERSPRTINCNFARRLQLNASGIAPFLDWQACTTTDASFCHHALGVYGVIYPPRFLAHLKQAGDGFLDCCPKADDLWLHVQAIRAGVQIRQISARSTRFPDLPNTGNIALWNENGRGGNDTQAAKTFTPADIRTLRNAPVAR